jgi:hypothetical protein
MQDLGATFGPTKVRWARWSQSPIWSDAARCTVSLEAMPFKGGHFTPVQISEGGRAWLAGRLTQLSHAQIQALFQSAGFPDPASWRATGDVSLWVKTFQDKVREIADRPPCPSLPD